MKRVRKLICIFLLFFVTSQCSLGDRVKIKSVGRAPSSNVPKVNYPALAPPLANSPNIFNGRNKDLISGYGPPVKVLPDDAIGLSNSASSLSQPSFKPNVPIGNSPNIYNGRNRDVISRYGPPVKVLPDFAKGVSNTANSLAVIKGKGTRMFESNQKYGSHREIIDYNIFRMAIPMRNYQYEFPQRLSYAEANQLIQRLKQSYDPEKNMKIDYLLGRIEAWQLLFLNDASFQFNSQNCPWCTVAGRMCAIQNNVVYTTTGLFFKNYPRFQVQGPLDLVRIAELFKYSGFDDVAYKSFNNGFSLKIYLLDLFKNYDSGTRMLFSLSYTHLQGGGHIVNYKVWITTQGELKTTAIDFQLDPANSQRNKQDFYPDGECHLFYDALNFPRSKRNVEGSNRKFRFLNSDEIKNYVSNLRELRSNEWIRLNDIINYYEKTDSKLKTEIDKIKNEIEIKFKEVNYHGSSNYIVDLRLTNHYLYLSNISTNECFNKCKNDDDCFAVTYLNSSTSNCYFHKNDSFGIP